MPPLTLSVVGRDRPGIVAAVTGALAQSGANVAASRASLLWGSFAMIVAVEVGEDTSIADVEAVLEPVARDLGLSVVALPCGGGAPDRNTEHCIVSVYGADRPGIVHDATAALAEIDADIIDMTSSLVGEPPIFILGMEVVLPKGVTIARVQSVLGSGVLRDLEVSVQPAAERV